MHERTDHLAPSIWNMNSQDRGMRCTKGSINRWDPRRVLPILFGAILGMQFSSSAQECFGPTQLNALDSVYNGQTGVMFDIRTTTHVVIDCFSTYFEGNDTIGVVEIWTRPGSYQGAVNDSTLWTLVGRTYDLPVGTDHDSLISIPIAVGVSILSGDSAGFAIVGSRHNGPVTPDWVRYATIGQYGSTYASDQNIALKSGTGVTGHFLAGVGGARMFRGAVHYSLLSTGTPDLRGNQVISLHPVPAQDQLNIVASDGSAIDRIDILDATGRAILSSTPGTSDTRIDVSRIRAGLHFLRIINKGDVITLRFLKA